MFIIRSVLIGICLTCLTGCIGLVANAIPLAIHGAGAAVDAEKDAYKDIEMTMSRGYTKEDIREIENISFLISSGNNDYFSQGIGTVFGDNLSKEFIKKGYEVIDRESIEDVMEEQKLQTSKFSSRNNLAKIGGILGVQGIFKGSVQSGQGFSQGFLGIGAEMKSGILSASLKLIDTKTAKTILIVSATYKKPKPASEVAADMAEAFKRYQDKQHDHQMSEVKIK